MKVLKYLQPHQKASCWGSLLKLFVAHTQGDLVALKTGQGKLQLHGSLSRPTYLVPVEG